MPKREKLNVSPEMLRRWKVYCNILLSMSFTWNLIEGTVSVTMGTINQNFSLFAFGLDSYIEITATGLVLYNVWKENRERAARAAAAITAAEDITPSEESGLISEQNERLEYALFSLETERKVTLLIGWLMILFCVFAAAGGIFKLVEHEEPATTTWGIIVSSCAIVAMTIQWYFKTMAAIILDSATVNADAMCGLACIGLSTVLFLGSLLFKVAPNLWWVDGVTAIIIGILVAREGYNTVKFAMDRENFTGGCGCCSGGTNATLGQYVEKRLRAQYGVVMVGTDDDDDSCKDPCCSGTKAPEQAERKDDTEKQKPACKGKCCKNKNKSKSNTVDMELVDTQANAKSNYGSCSGCKNKNCGKNKAQAAHEKEDFV